MSAKSSDSVHGSIYGGLAILAALVSSLLASAARADLPSDWKEPDLMTITPGRAFIPTGFDDNDRTQVVVTGALRNTCYKVGPSLVKVDRAGKRILINQQAYFYTGCFCLQVLIPYQQTIDVGILPQGNYTVQFVNETGSIIQMGMLPVAHAKTRAPDDYLYAPVAEATVENLPGAVPVLHLSGTFGSDCLAVRDVQVINRAPNVIEVLPIADVKPGAACSVNPTPFSINVKLEGLSYPLHGSTLIHVRSMNGQALNKVVEF